jgi:hypothetical protein
VRAAMLNVECLSRIQELQSRLFDCSTPGGVVRSPTPTLLDLPDPTTLVALRSQSTAHTRVGVLSMGRVASTIMLGDAVVVPWPKLVQGDDTPPPCLSCTSHGWCMAIRSAVGTESAPVLPSTQSDLEQAALRRVSLMLVDSAGNAVTYSRVKARLLDEFGDDLVERIKPRVRGILRDAADEIDRQSTGSTPTPSDLGQSQNSGSSEPSWARTCLFETEPAPESAHGGGDDGGMTGPDADDEAGASSVDVTAMQQELDHWETELDKLEGTASEEEQTLQVSRSRRVWQHRLAGFLSVCEVGVAGGVHQRDRRTPSRFFSAGLSPC